LKIPFIFSQASLPNRASEIRNNTSPEINKNVVAAATSPFEIPINGNVAIIPHVTNDKTRQIYPNIFFKLMVPFHSHDTLLAG